VTNPRLQAAAGGGGEPAAKKARTSNQPTSNQPTSNQPTSSPSADAIARLMALAAKHGAGDKDIAQAAAFK